MFNILIEVVRIKTNYNIIFLAFYYLYFYLETVGCLVTNTFH